MLARAGTEIENLVGGQHRIGIVLDDKQRVAQIAQALQNFDQAVRIARMQADRRLVEHVERADEVRSERRRKLNTLRFAARQGRGEPVEREIVEPDFVEKAVAAAGSLREFFRRSRFRRGLAAAHRKTVAPVSRSSGRLR